MISFELTASMSLCLAFSYIWDLALFLLNANINVYIW